MYTYSEGGQRETVSKTILNGCLVSTSIIILIGSSDKEQPPTGQHHAGCSKIKCNVKKRTSNGIQK